MSISTKSSIPWGPFAASLVNASAALTTSSPVALVISSAFAATSTPAPSFRALFSAFRSATSRVSSAIVALSPDSTASFDSPPFIMSLSSLFSEDASGGGGGGPCTSGAPVFTVVIVFLLWRELTLIRYLSLCLVV